MLSRSEGIDSDEVVNEMEATATCNGKKSMHYPALRGAYEPSVVPQQSINDRGRIRPLLQFATQSLGSHSPPLGQCSSCFGRLAIKPDSALGRRDFTATHLQASNNWPLSLFFLGTSREQVRMTAGPQLSAQRPSSNLHSSPEDLMYVHRNLQYASDSPGVRVRRRASSCETDRCTTNECSAVKRVSGTLSQESSAGVL